MQAILSRFVHWGAGFHLLLEPLERRAVFFQSVTIQPQRCYGSGALLKMRNEVCQRLRPGSEPTLMRIVRFVICRKLFLSVRLHQQYPAERLSSRAPHDDQVGIDAGTISSLKEIFVSTNI